MLSSIHIFGIHISLYSAMLFLGIVSFFIMYFVLVEKREKLGRTNSNRFVFVSALGIVVLGASAFVMNSVFHSIERGEIFIGGITWLGGVVWVIPFMLLAIHKFVPKAKGSAVEYFSLIIPGLVLGHAFGRVGCFLGGCCYGAPTDSVFGVVFPVGSAAAEQYPAFEGGPSVPVLPTQLFEAAFELLLFIIMIVFYKKLKRYNVEIYMIAYGVFRFILEFFRGDDRGATGFVLSPSQFMCILLLLGAILLILFRNDIIFKKLNDKCVVWRQEAAAYVAPRTKKQSDASLETIKELHSMMEAGIISQEEYEKKKSDILKRL